MCLGLFGHGPEADMEGKRRLIEGKEWSVDSVEGGRELFRMMCIEAGKTTPDGTMWLGDLGQLLVNLAT